MSRGAPPLAGLSQCEPMLSAGDTPRRNVEQLREIRQQMEQETLGAQRRDGLRSDSEEPKVRAKTINRRRAAEQLRSAGGDDGAAARSQSSTRDA